MGTSWPPVQKNVLSEHLVNLVLTARKLSSRQAEVCQPYPNLSFVKLQDLHPRASQARHTASVAMPAMICSIIPPAQGARTSTSTPAYPQLDKHTGPHTGNSLTHVAAVKEKIEGSQQEQEPAVQHTALMLCQL